MHHLPWHVGIPLRVQVRTGLSSNLELCFTEANETSFSKCDSNVSSSPLRQVCEEDKKRESSTTGGTRPLFLSLSFLSSCSCFFEVQLGPVRKRTHATLAPMSKNCHERSHPRGRTSGRCQTADHVSAKQNQLLSGTVNVPLQATRLRAAQSRTTGPMSGTKGGGRPAGRRNPPCVSRRTRPHESEKQTLARQAR